MQGLNLLLTTAVFALLTPFTIALWIIVIELWRDLKK